jgi:microcystin degradation protein MlrC
MTIRIAVGQISSESNHFVHTPCELDFFYQTGYVRQGDELLGLAGTDTEVAGMLAILQQAEDVEIVPLLAARANSSGILSAECYKTLKDLLLAPLRVGEQVDGVLLSHHGSMASVVEDDPEGDIAASVRELVGPSVPIVMTLDLHGNITARMVKASTAILGYEHYPHDDTFHTGERGAGLLLQAVRKQVQLVMAHAKLPLILTGFHASTAGGGPFAQLMAQAKILENEPSVLSTSLSYVGSYIDVPEVGCSALVITNGEATLAEREARRLAQALWDLRWEFMVDTISIAEAVKRGRQIEGGPVLLLDTADTTGGGACGDSIDLVKGLLDAGVTEPCLTMIVDPEAVQQCLHKDSNGEILLELGHKLDPRWGVPLQIRCRILRKVDGRFCYTGGILGGSWVSMGPSVVLTVGSIQILVMSYPTYDWADEQYRAASLHPKEAKFVGVKNMMNFRYGYRDSMKGYFVLDLPGPTPSDMRQLPFRRVGRPLFPLDEELTEPAIGVTLSGI